MDAEQTKVYVPDANVSWVEATITKGHVVNEKTVEVVLDGDDGEEDIARHPEAGSVRTVEKDSIHLQNNLVDPNGCDDMVNLNYLHEPAILYNLKQRFFRRIPYTYTGPICIAVNPYAWLNIYTEEMQEQYLVKDRSELPPHVYATSAGAYQHMRMFGEDQSILVSGESGAGKTETTKILMSHLALAGNTSGNMATSTVVDEKSIIDRVLHANPLMESFGNAKTSRNDNSSRFGKFSELQFNALGQLVGARSRTYLLEKSRVSIQGQGERNYHIFYQLLAAPNEITTQVQLEGMHVHDFPFVKPLEGDETASSMSSKDADKFQQTMACLRTMGVTSDDQIELLRVIAAILHLSRLQFEDIEGNTDDATQLATDGTNLKTRATVSTLLGFPEEDLQQALCTRQMSLSASENYQVPLTTSQAQGVRTALGVALYSHLFQWLIHRVNASTSAPHSDVVNKICILDIFGFEIFEKNSFEQLCINYANEKLQQKFTQDVFKSIQSEYEEEGIPWTKIEFADNANVLELIESRFGVLSLLNEECMRPKGSDAAFASKLKAHYNDNDRFESPRFARDAFIIKHYAGPVQYDSTGFLIKNTDALQNDLLVLVGKSKSEFVKHLFSSETNKNAAASGGANAGRNAALKRRTSALVSDTVGTQFKSQLNGLMEDIRRTNVHYIRCIKPNSRKSSQTFCKLRVTEQLKCAGVVEAVRISRMAFPNRMLQTVFLERFRGLAGGVIAPVSASDPEEAIVNAARDLLANHLMQGKDDQYQMGKTRIFFRKGALEGLEEQRSRKLNEAAVVLQRYVKKWRAQAAFRAIRRAAVRIQTTFRGFSARKLFKTKRRCAIKIECAIRRYGAQKLLVSMRRNYRATKIQTIYRMHVCRVKFVKTHNAIILIQSIIRMFNAVRAYVVMQEQAQEDAKLENQIRLLKQRLQEERDARRELEQGMRSSMFIRNEEALEGADEVIEQLRRENATLKEANSNLKAFNTQLRKDKDVMERGAYVNGASFAAANQRATKLQEEVEMLKGAHTKIKATHRLLKMQNLAAMEKVTAMQNGLNEALQERNILRHTLEQYKSHAEHMQNENVALAKANARLRLILRQDPELSRKHRDEVPKLTKLAYAAKQTLAPNRSKAQTSPLPVDTKFTFKVSLDTLAPPESPITTPTGQGLTPLKRPSPVVAASKKQDAKGGRVVNIRDIAVEDEALSSLVITMDTLVADGTSFGDHGKSPVTAKSPSTNGIRQPTGEDGPIAEPAKVMGLIPDTESEGERVSFSVTLNIDPAEKEKEKERASLTSAPKGFGTNTPNKQGANNKAANAKAYRRRGSQDAGDISRGSSLRGSFNSGGNNMRASFTGYPSGPGQTTSGYDPRNSSLRATFTGGSTLNGGAPANRGRDRRGSYDRSNSLKNSGNQTPNNTQRPRPSDGNANGSSGLGMGGKHIEL